MKYDRLELSLTNVNESINDSNKLIIDLIKYITEISSKPDLIVTRSHLELITKQTGDSKSSENKVDNNIDDNKSVLINENTMQCIELFCNNPMAIGNLLSLLELYNKMKIVMNDSMYKEFRREFTKVYLDAFGNPCYNSSYIYDTIEINRLLRARQINYVIIVINSGNQSLRYMVINKDEPVELKMTAPDYYLLNSNNHMDIDICEDEGMYRRIELETFLKLHMKIHPVMNEHQYEIFIDEFIKLYNTLYDDIDASELRNVEKINDLLEREGVSYQIKCSRKKRIGQENKLKWHIVRS